MCSSVWSRLSPVFSWKFVCYSYPLQTFRSKVFFEKWNGNEKTKEITQKRELGMDKWYNQMGQVGTSWGQVGQGEGGLQILVGQVGQGEGGLQIFVGQVGQGQGVCPLEPFHFSHMGLQGRGTFRISFLLFPSVFHEHVGTGIVRIFLFPSLFCL